jgi:hypothetical protein
MADKHLGNDTRLLTDLTNEQVKRFLAETLGDKWDNAGSRRLSTMDRIAALRKSLTIPKDPHKVENQAQKIAALEAELDLHRSPIRIPPLLL